MAKLFEDNPTGNILGYVSGCLGFLFMEAGAMENLDLGLGILLKITSLISFVVFVFLNYFKVKEKIKEIRKKKNEVHK